MVIHTDLAIRHSDCSDGSCVVSHPILQCQLADLSPGCSPVHSLVEAHLTSTALQRSSEGSPFKPLDLDQQLRDFVKANEGAWGGVSEQGLSDNSMATLSQSSQLSAKNVAILYSQMEVWIIAHIHSHICCYIGVSR